MGQMVEPAIDALAGFSSFPPTAPRGSTGGADHAVPDGPRRAAKSDPIGQKCGKPIRPFAYHNLRWTQNIGYLLASSGNHDASIPRRSRVAGRYPTPDNISSLSEPSLVWLHRWPHTIGTRDWRRVGRSGSLNDQGRVPSPVIKIPMARNNVAVMDYQVHEIDRVHQFFRGPVRTRLAYPDLIAPVLRLKIHILHDPPHFK